MTNFYLPYLPYFFPLLISEGGGRATLRLCYYYFGRSGFVFLTGCVKY